MIHFELVNPRWDFASSTLFVSSCLQGDPDCFEKVEVVVKYCMRWVSFIETRFGGVGRCAKHWLRSVAVGLDAIFQIVQENPAINHYEINLYSRSFELPVRMWFLTAAFACRPLDNIMIFLLKDDRFLKHREHLWSKMRADIADVTAYSDAFFDEVASMAGISASVSGKKLRSEVQLTKARNSFPNFVRPAFQTSVQPRRP